MRDISRQKQASLELEQRALHDSLTGIPNRTLFNDRLQQAIVRAERKNRVRSAGSRSEQLQGGQ